MSPSEGHAPLAPAAEPASESWVPEREFDGYRLLQPIGRGTMGRVYLAEDTLLERPVAVKFIAQIDASPSARERFFLEARAIARVQHPNVVAVHRVGEVSGQPYLISEYVRGESLDRLPRPMPWARAYSIALGLARGLAAAHRHGVVHRDIKPANAILSELGEAKLLDFGLAKLVAPIQLGASLSPTPGARPPPSDPPPRTDPELQPVRTLDSTQDLPLLHEEHGPRFAAALESTGTHQAPAGGAVAMTMPGQAMGTPLYMAPEVWRGEAASYRSDVYSLGALLYQLVCGRPPHDRPTLQELKVAVLGGEPSPLTRVAPLTDPRFAAAIDRCLRSEPALRFASGDELRDALEQLSPGAAKSQVPEGNPYRGLSAFEAEHRALFFGREGAIRSLINRLRTDPLVAVVGDSGVGKSSVCRAGVLPSVAEGALEGRRYRTFALVPGRLPLRSLAEVLAPALQAEPAALSLRLQQDAASVSRELRLAQGDAGVLLFLDQLEELVTLSEPEEAQAFAEALAWLTSAPDVKVLATLRGDFLTRVAALPRIGEDLARAIYLLRPLSRDGTREAIVGPARAKGVTLEPGLVDTLVESSARAEGSLPLLQFALAELWEERDPSRPTIARSALDAIGGVEGALSRHADAVLAALPPAQREAARRCLLSLVTTERTRARRSEHELVGNEAAARSALEALVRGRLLVAREMPEGAVYELAHEALLAGWPTLRRWLDESSDSRLVRERLLAAVLEWERLGSAREGLWRGKQLLDAARLGDSELTHREKQFLAESAAAARRQRAIGVASALAVVLVVAAVALGIHLRATAELTRRVDTALLEGTSALEAGRVQVSVAEGLRLRAFDAFDQGGAVAETLWTTALAADNRAQHTLARASQLLESAVSLDPQRKEVRARFADALQARALHAEATHQAETLQELLQRLALYDDSGARRRAFLAPASVTLQAEPSGSRIEVARVANDAEGRRSLEPQGPSLLSPAELTLPPGSYLVTFSAPGRSEVRLPLRLNRGEHLVESVTLPTEANVPRDFVLVPEGRFLYGTTADEGLRRGFLQAAPMHLRKTKPYLIARHEVTFADWLSFLEALPAAERERRLPRATNSMVGGLLELRGAPGDWHLVAQLNVPGAQAASARVDAALGQPVVHPSRDRRAKQDWSALPVSGINLEDALAYARWLASSGRVPGARLCSELEWERAARGADEREFPHGDQLLPDDANFDETYGKDPRSFGPDEVGSHAASRSPFGVDDLAGNVWEWVVPAQGPASGAVIRGGSYYHDRNSSRAINRGVVEPTLRDSTVGMRVCATVNITPNRQR